MGPESGIVQEYKDKAGRSFVPFTKITSPMRQ